MNLSERALRLRIDTAAALNLPMVRMLPGPVVRVFEEQAAVLAELAEQVRRLELLMDLGGADDHEG